MVYRTIFIKVSSLKVPYHLSSIHWFEETSQNLTVIYSKWSRKINYFYTTLLKFFISYRVDSIVSNFIDSLRYFQVFYEILKLIKNFQIFNLRFPSIHSTHYVRTQNKSALVNWMLGSVYCPTVSVSTILEILNKKVQQNNNLLWSKTLQLKPSPSYHNST